MYVRWSCLLFLAAIPFVSSAQVLAPVVVSTNTTIRVMAANLTTSNFQRYETPGLNIMKGLQPDVVAIQEFNYQSATYPKNSDAGFREMLDNTFGTNFVYFREGGSKSIPNGVISRFPILTNGVWDDIELSDREFVWAKLDIPGTNELYVVSVHLKASDDSASTTKRANQATALKSLVQSNFPASAFVVIAGDFNIHSSTEAALTTFEQFLSDFPIPTDGVSGSSTNMNTNASRSKRFDYVLPSFLLSSNQVPTVIGSKSFSNGLVFDSRVYTPLPSPILFEDSGATNMQHMAVVKDFQIDYTVTNYVTVTSPRLELLSNNLMGWSGQSNVTYTVQASSNLTAWATAGSATSSSSNFVFTIPGGVPHPSFYRVMYP
ncbi:MAG: endonuclease/exonuclease/phosphatase family protein [Verrucomicrobia bacterium]|nr:endonuclease/exonuclease/phosphatase family protein [Verrucomicrobiota bacterium]